MSEEKVEQPKVGELPPLDEQAEARMGIMKDSPAYAGEAWEILAHCRERQLLAEQQVSAALRASLAEAIAQRDKALRLLAEALPENKSAPAEPGE